MAESVSTSELKQSLIGFPAEFPYEFDSPAFTSSSSNSTETEDESSDDEEDFLAGLTRRLALSTQRVAVPSFPLHNPESLVVASSPQSTLSGLSSWSASGNGSPNGPSSQVASPPTTPVLCSKEETWDVVHRAAGEVARLKINGETQINAPNHATPKSLVPPPPPSGPLLAHLQKTQNPNFHLHHGHPPDYSNTNQILSQKESAKLQCSSDWGFYWQTELEYRKLGFRTQRKNEFPVRELGKYQKPLDFFHSGNPPRQSRQQLLQSRSPGVGSGGYKPGFSVKRQSAGTGVFLPRNYSNPSDESRKKPTCSPVLVPARVVHALNRNCEDMSCFSESHLASGFGGSYHNALMAKRHALLLQHQRRSFRQNQELPLPQEWMY